jgi:phosphatidylglycerophosphatase A
LAGQTPKNSNSSALDRAAYLAATGLGAGLLPVAPGTFGAIEGVAIFLGVAALAHSHPDARIYSISYSLLNMVVFAVGVVSAERVSRMLNQKDPGRVVIDEVSGQMIALSPLLFTPKPLGVVVGFILFRAFDIFKPYPIRKLEALPGGFGVMADDVLAGIFAAVLLWAGHAWGVL